MVGFLIIAHGDLGEALLQCAAHVMGGKQPHLMQLSVKRSDEPDEMERRARAIIETLDQGDGVLVFADIFGATPCNIASRVLRTGSVEGVTGVNLPMLVRVLCHRDEPLAEVVQKALSGGREGVIDISKDPCNAQTRNRDPQ